MPLIEGRLAVEELRIFQAGRAAVIAFDQWRDSDLVPPKSSATLKRKFSAGANPADGQPR